MDTDRLMSVLKTDDFIKIMPIRLKNGLTHRFTVKEDEKELPAGKKNPFDER